MMRVARLNFLEVDITLTPLPEGVVFRFVGIGGNVVAFTLNRGCVAEFVDALEALTTNVSPPLPRVWGVWKRVGSWNEKPELVQCCRTQEEAEQYAGIFSVAGPSTFYAAEVDNA